MKKMRGGWLVGSLVGGAFLALVALESRRPLRRGVESKLRRNVRNLAVGAIGAATIQLAEVPVTWPVALWVEQRGWGLLRVWRLPSWLETGLAFLLLDYTLYWWHILLHRVPLLWRGHRPHHVDLDMDSSTALRFHFFELTASVPWRAGQIALIGVSPSALLLWQTAALIEIMFHHSNWRLPAEVERWLSRLIVTPRMHGIHHSVVPDEQNSNFSSGLSLWDYLHGTFVPPEDKADVTIGDSDLRDPRDVTLPKVLALPFSTD